MNRILLHRLSTSVLATAIAIVMVLIGSSCNDFVYEDMPECPQGLRLRFIYKYNMEDANAFPSQVHCLTLLVYDNEGHYVQTCTVTDSELLSDEDWRMTLDLPAGGYQLLAYGGMACADASFAFKPQPGSSVPMTDVEVFLKPECISRPDGTDLHDLFYGALEVTVPEDGLDYTDATVSMMKDTNNLRIILQHLDYTPVKYGDFTFEVTADNTLFNYKNNIIPTETTTFMPWSHGEETLGSEIVGDEVVNVQAGIAYAEFSLSRLMVNGGARLEIQSANDGGEVVSIPLAKYLLLLKSDRYKKMDSQEFLDRESRWTLFFFLDRNNRWVKTKIIINDWVVRINDIEAW